MGEDPSIPVIVERIKNVQDDVTEIKLNMATRTDQAHVDDRIKDLVGALASEKAERVAAVEKEALARDTQIRAEAGERRKVAERLQAVEDRMENRKYTVAIAILLAAVSTVLGVIGNAQSLLGGG